MGKRDELVESLYNRKDSCYFIHYSCENLNDNNDELSPRVTAIVLLHYGSQQMVTFSTHSIAEELKIKKEDVQNSFDRIEETLLSRFYKYVLEYCDGASWIHWNMRSDIFGFEHLEHRYRVLTGKEPVIIPVDKRYNLNSMLTHKYGSQYVDDPKMLTLMELNGGKAPDFLTGAEEVTAFRARDYVKMLKSTICKVRFFCITFNKMKKNELKTKKNNFRYKINQFFQHPIVQIISFIGILASIAAIPIAIMNSLGR